MLLTRILTAAVLIPLVLAALFLLPPRTWALVSLAVMVIGAHEWAALTGLEKRRWLLFVGGTFLLGFNLVLGPGMGFDRGWPDIVVMVVCGLASAFWILVAPFWLHGRWRLSNALVAALLGWLILIATWMAVVQLQARSPWLVLAAMATVWIADSAAYFAGRTFGRNKLAPAISPGKTWEGVGGALVAVGAYAVALAIWSPGFGYTGPRSATALAALVVLAMALTAVSVVGDLFESLLKRQRGVKDSGKLLPGHGGILDRIDALAAAMPVAAVLVTLWLR